MQTLADKIYQQIKNFQLEAQTEVLDFVQFLITKNKKHEDSEAQEWSNLSVAAAMRGMEGEPSEYSLNDLKEKF